MVFLLLRLISIVTWNLCNVQTCFIFVHDNYCCQPVGSCTQISGSSVSFKCLHLQDPYVSIPVDAIMGALRVLLGTDLGSFSIHLCRGILFLHDYHEVILTC